MDSGIFFRYLFVLFFLNLAVKLLKSKQNIVITCRKTAYRSSLAFQPAGNFREEILPPKRGILARRRPKREQMHVAL